MAPRSGAAGPRVAAVLVAGAVATGAWVPAAAAAEPGVHIDPSSPAGKEYALPVDQARRDAGGSATQGGSGSHGGQGDLFGAGIGPSGGGGGGTGAGHTGGHATGGSHGSAKAATRHASGGSPGSGPTAGNRVSSPNSGSSDGALIGIVGGVLLLGAACGLGARRLRAQGT